MTRAFAREGAKVVAVDIRADRLAELKVNMPDVITVTADVSKEEDVDRLVETTGKDLDIVCNNAGILDGMSPVEDTSPELWAHVLSVNLTAVYLMCRRAIPVLLQRGGGVILNTASGGGLRGGRAGAAYTASKFGVVGLTQNVAVTHGPLGIAAMLSLPGAWPPT